MKGEGIPLIFLHGMGGSVEQIYSTYKSIAGVKLICLNQQGHGNSGVDWEYYDFNHLGDDAAALMEHLKIEKAMIAGISMGAAVALNIAARYPDKVEKLILIRNAWTDQPMSPDIQLAYEDLGKCLKEGGKQAFYQTNGWKLAEESSAYTRNAFTCVFEDASCLKHWQKYLILPKKTPVSSDDLKNLNKPVVILACRQDLCHPFLYGEYLHKAIPKSKLVEIPDKATDKTMHIKQINQEIYNAIDISN